jgi:hypothetical protein
LDAIYLKKSCSPKLKAQEGQQDAVNKATDEGGGDTMFRKTISVVSPNVIFWLKT